MSRDRLPFQAQGTWRDGALQVWGWNGADSATADWFFSGYGRFASGIGTDWHDSPVSYGELGRLELDLPDGGTKRVAAVHLDPYGAAIWLSAPPDEASLSPSLAWFTGLTRFAAALVNAGNLSPSVETPDGYREARWRAVLTDDQRDQLRYVATHAPPICTNGSDIAVETILHQLVDGMARAILTNAGWRPELGRRRQPEVQAARGVFSALATRDPAIRVGSADYDSAVDALAVRLDQHARRLAGEPVLRPRLRLTLPDDPLDPWVVVLELVDDDGRWCTAADAWSHSPLAVDIAGTEHLDLVAATATDARSLLIDAAVYGCDRLGSESGTFELDLDEADEFLALAPHQLERVGVELIGPEHLVTATVRVAGSVSTQPPDDRPGRFSKDALIEWSAQIDDTPITAADLERAVEAGRSLLRTGHRWVRIDPARLRRANKFIADHSSHVSPIELLRLGAETLDEIDDDDENDHIEISLDVDDHHTDEWVQRLLDGLPDTELDEGEESSRFVGELRHYQRRALSWMRFLAELGLGGVLADDMGLGKTATTLAHLLDRPGPHLVVCPLSVVHNWESEARRFAPSLTTMIHHGAERSTGELSLFGLADADIVITTYGLVSRDLGTLGQIDWNTLVLDEAQNIKNPTTKAAKAVRALSTGQRIALTGTPVENRLSELWAILDAVNPKMLGSQQAFRDQFSAVIERGTDPTAAAMAAARLRGLTGPFVLRRTKADRTLLPDLPDKIEQIAFAALTAEQASLYQQVVDQLLVDAKDLEGMQRRGRVLAALTRLKQICNHPVHALKDGTRLEGRSGKLNRFDELITDVLDVGERSLVFTQFREMGDLLQTHLRNRFELDVDFLHGGVTRTGRDRMVSEFQAGQSPLLIVSLKAGGTGLNLTAASHVIHYDRWWNPAVEDQATDRAWRFGQDRTVMVHKLVCQGTVEEKIGQVIDEKRALADAVVGTGEQWLSELSTDELADLVTLGTS